MDGRAGHDPAQLLAAMSPRLHRRRCVFATLPHDATVPPALEVFASVREREGLSVVVDAEEAEAHGLSTEFPCAWITLEVRSALAAVGFLAMVTRALADAGISANAVAGFHHDHVFVPWSVRDEALAVLEAASRDGC